MADAGRDLTDTLFGAPTATAAPVDQWRQTLKLDDLERQHNLPSGLMTSVLRQESGGDPRVKSSAGAQGLFQFMPATAAQYKIDPFDPQQAAPAAAKELSTLYRKYRGDVDRTLAAWNWGQGNVDRKGMANMPSETRGFLTNVKRFLSPGVAEAATPTSGRDLTTTLGQGSPGGGRDLTDLLFQPAAPQTPVEAPRSPQEPSTTPDDATHAAETMARLRGSQAGAMGIQPPPADMSALAVGGGPSQQAQPVTDPAALLAGGRGTARPWREDDPLAPGQQRLGVPEEAPVEEGFTKPSTMVPLIMGLGIPGLTTAAPGMAAAERLVGKAGPLITRGARAVGEGLSQTLGWTAGRTAETGKVPSPGEIGTEAALNVATGGVVEIPSALRATKNAALRATPGAQILLNQRAVQEAEGLGKRVFNAQDKEVVGKAFDAVVATGEKLDTSPVRTLWQSLTPAEQRIAGNELSKISSTFADALKTKKLGDWDIGDLQHLRSELRTASMSKRTPETIDLLQSMRSAVDDAIANGMAKGSLPAAELIAAQKAYRKVMQAEDLQGLVTRHTKDSPNLEWQELNLAALNKEIRGGGRKKVQELMKGMDATERQGLMQELDSLKRLYPFVRVNRLGTAVTGVGGSIVGGAIGGPVGAVVPLILSAAVSSPRVMSMFKRSIIEGKGLLATHHVDALLNAIRHEND